MGVDIDGSEAPPEPAINWLHLPGPPHHHHHTPLLPPQSPKKKKKRSKANMVTERLFVFTSVSTWYFMVFSLPLSLCVCLCVFCVWRCGRVRKKHHCEADEDPTRQRLQRGVSATSAPPLHVTPAACSLPCTPPLLMHNTAGAGAQPPLPTLPWIGFSPGTAAPVGPSIPMQSS